MNKSVLNTLQNILTAPGEGVYTVHTGAYIKKSIYPFLYKGKCPTSHDSLIDLWKSSFQNFNKYNVFLLGICSDSGAGILRGSNWGPLFLREQIYKNIINITTNKQKNNSDERYKQQSFFDLGDVKVIPHLLHDKYLNSETIKKCQDSIYMELSNELKRQLPVSPLSIAKLSLDLIFKEKQNAKFLTLGGDHSISYPILSSIVNHFQDNLQQEIAVIHFDAHTDLMHSRLGIDYCFASWASHIISKLKEPSNFIQFGIRSSGKNQKYWQDKFKIKQYWASELKEKELIKSIIDFEIDRLKSKNIKKIYISFDIDALDIAFASSTGTPEKDGLSLDNSCFIIKKLVENFELIGCDLVEVAPFSCSVDQYKKDEPNNTLNSSQVILKLFLDALNVDT